MGAGEGLHHFDGALALALVGGFIEAVQQGQAVAGAQQLPEVVGGQALVAVRGSGAEVRGQPLRRVLQARPLLTRALALDVVQPVGDRHQHGHSGARQAQTLPCPVHGAAQPVARQAVGDPAQEGGLAGARVTDDDRAGLAEGLLQRGVGRAGVRLCAQVAAHFDGALSIPAKGATAGCVELNIEFLDGESMGARAAGDQAADVDVGGVVPEVCEVLAGSAAGTGALTGLGLSPRSKSAWPSRQSG
jgi:hypothetical protein